MVFGGNQPVFKGFYGNPGVKSFLPHAKTPDLYAYIQQRKCLGCSLKSSPSDDNPYHADIVIPIALDAEERRDDVIEYATGLAYHSTFLPWGEWTKTA